MNAQDAQTIIAIAVLAAAADGRQSDAERANLAGAAGRLGLTVDPALMQRAASGAIDLAALAASLSSDEARVAAYDAAAAVCHADGIPNERESAFLASLSHALGAVSASPDAAATTGAAAAGVSTPPGAPAGGDLDTFILDQAMLTGACELLPHRLATLAVLPLQLRMVHAIGQRHGQALDMAQVKDLAAVVGIGAAGHLVEGVVRGFVGGVGRGLFGGLLGGAAGMASGTAVTFATTYALGHAAEQYYAQGRRLGADDLRKLFARFRDEAGAIWPRVEGRIRQLASGTNLSSVLAGLRA